MTHTHGALLYAHFPIIVKRGEDKKERKKNMCNPSDRKFYTLFR